ncbi:gas vesicle protein [Metabacillus sp. KIGAM252]|uniref:Gas vesicle protein n=1 Tax=Metabacillus flavus TaxID=2823519 RepID=A0ABS5L9W5_9BACI|nr:gas vesicle protein [Metabacillus flavus]
MLSEQTSSIVDVLERILDKGVVIAGDIRINLADVELLTIKIRLIVASVDKAKEIGLDWWERDPYLSSKAHPIEERPKGERTGLLDALDLKRLI